MRLTTNAATAVIPVAVLFGCTLFAQSYSPLYAPASSNLQQYVCVDVATGDVVPGAQWWIDFQGTGYYANTNYHNHALIVPYPPRSNYSPSSGNADGDGFFSFSLLPTLVAHEEYYTVYCVNPGGQAVPAALEFGVGYSDLYWVSQPVFYQTGGNTTNHGDNTGDHWMQSGPANQIYITAVQYLNMYNPGRQICTNDMALPYGGKFDIHDDWKSPHAAHDRGSGVDVNFTRNQCPSYNLVYPSQFLNVCLANGSVGGGVSYCDSNDCHCNFLNPSNYPH